MRYRLTRDLVCAALITALGVATLALPGPAAQPTQAAWVDPVP